MGRNSANTRKAKTRVSQQNCLTIKMYFEFLFKSGGVRTNLGHTQRASPDPMYYITLHQKTIYSGLSKSNLKIHCGDIVITQCLGEIAEIKKLCAKHGETA